MTELVQTFRFVLHLARSPSPGPTGSGPPFLAERGRTRPGGQAVGSPTAPRTGAVGTAPVGGQSAGQGAAGLGAQPPDRLCDGGFAECTGLELGADVKEYLEGGSNAGVVRRIGRVKLQPIVLKRGLLVVDATGYADTKLWDWLQNIVAGRVPVPRYDGSIDVMDPSGGNVVAHWTFSRGLPSKVAGPTLNAKTGEIAVEELHIEHERLRLEPGP
jgi:phage tail-like protein